MGGGENHRMSLSDAALIKDNHVLAAGGVAKAFVSVRKNYPNIPLEVEVDSLDQLKEVGITEFIFIVGYLGEKIQDYVQATYPQLTTHFLYQNDRLGTAHAIELAKSIVGEDEVFISLGDTICEFDMKEVMDSPCIVLG